MVELAPFTRNLTVFGQHWSGFLVGFLGQIGSNVLHWNPIPFAMSDDEILVGECGGNGRQIVRCRDISASPKRR
jgi:hypothetical protein